MKKTIHLFFVLILMFLLCGCYTKVEEEFAVEEIKMIEMQVNEKLNFTDINYEYNTCIITSFEDGVYVTTPGEMLISSQEGKYYIVVKEEQKSITATADNLILIGDTSQINVIINPEGSSQNVSYLSTDNNIIKVDDNGLVSGISSGIARVIISSNNYLDITTELTFVVIEEDEEYYEPIIENIITNENIYVDEDINSLKLQNVIQASNQSLVSITSYHTSGLSTSKYYSCGMIYKMNIHYADGSVKEDVKEYVEEKEIKKFEYYVLTTASYAAHADELKILAGENEELIDAEFIQYDSKTFIAVLKFESKYFYPVAKIGDSDDVNKGEFIISLGSGNDTTYFRSYTLGVISGVRRYFNSDTDFDGIADWDDEYFQHDALIGRSAFGGFLINLKGEAIAINLDKMVGTNYNNISLAKPINNVMRVVKILETGEAPQRPVLGVQIFSVKSYRLNKDAFDKVYPDANIPEDLKYGMYVTDVTAGGVADKCGVKVNDILIKFNGVILKDTYDIRPQLGNIIINSGTEAELVVLRDGVEITLRAVF